MCGIAGILTKRALDEAAVRRLVAPIAHRGPDSDGVWLDAEAGIGFGHRRLSIVDLSPAGYQPMHSSNGRYVLNFNGEIYNHAELKGELEATRSLPPEGWRGHSDTEVLVQAIAAWGVEGAVRKSAGMFAFALWDRSERSLTLVRDRFGEKPLYYGWAGSDFLFGSELKALRAHPFFANPISRRAVRQFAHLTYVPAPFSIYERIFKLQPGCILKLTLEAAADPQDMPPVEGTRASHLWLNRYWSYRNIILRGLEDPIADEGAALEQLEQVLSTAISEQSVADVPIGAFLSGGVDSSTVVALYQKNATVPVRTYSIGFEEARFNEADDARRVAEHLGTLHHEHYVTVQEARDTIPLLPAIYDEPFADSSQIPTYLVSRFARGDVKVALTGDGGDEMFAGYNRHFSAPYLWSRLRRVPKPLRMVASSVLGGLPPSFWGGVFGLLRGRRSPGFSAKVQKALRVAGRARSFDDVYNSFLDEWTLDPPPVRNGETALFDTQYSIGNSAPDTLRVMYRDAIGYLPDDILCKVDRASMAVSLETRVPYLDHRVAEFAARIPLDLKVRNGRGKHLLRQLLSRELPRELFDRPKTGFAVPVGQWISGPLRPWAEELLDAKRLDSEGWFNTTAIRQRWNQHLSGQRDSTAAIWAVLMFQAWLDHPSTPTLQSSESAEPLPNRALGVGAPRRESHV